MNLNPLALAIGVVVIAGGGMYVMGSGHNDVKNVTVKAAAPALPRSNDTIADSSTSGEDVATLIAMSKAQNEHYAKLEDKYKDLQAKVEMQASNNNQNQQSLVDSVVNKINQSGALDVDSAVNDKLTDLENQLRSFTDKDKVDNASYIDDYGVAHSTTTMGSVFNDGSQSHNVKTASNNNGGYSLGIQQEYNGWIMPDDGQLVQEDNGHDLKPTFALKKSQIFSQNTGNTLYQAKPKEVTKDGKLVDHVTRFGTIPQDATLMGAVTMTALLGRIPVKGKLVDPFEFKVLLGADNLASNGIYIPNLKSMVMRGVAKGNYTGQCVSGDIISGTFTFNDGRIQSFSGADLDQDSSSSYEAAGQVDQDRVGWISTMTGIPCVSGEYISDAPSFIGLQGGLAALGGISNGFAAAAQQVTGSGDNQSKAITDPTQFAIGTGGDAAVKSMSQWIEDIRQTAFAMVYVKPNQKIAINITKEIPIDYHSTARKVSYANEWGNNEQNLD